MINPVALTFMQSTSRAQLQGMGIGHDDDGPAYGGGLGLDSNNYMDTRNAQQVSDQGTVRIDHIFANGDTLDDAATRCRAKTDSTPQNMPGFGFKHDNLSQQSTTSWIRVANPHLVNTASLSLSRLSMNHTSQNDGVNDIVSQLGILGVGFGGAGAWGSPSFNVQGYSAMGDSYMATPMHAWDTTIEGP
jgi:hypothetical protein